MKYFLRVCVGLACWTVVACSENDFKTPDIGLDYFPHKVGLYQVYDVEETIYELGTPETFLYELKTVVVDSFLNSDNQYTYVIHRSKRNEGEDDWQYQDTWSFQKSNQEVIVSEENVPYVRMRFPIRVGLEWNGNAYNTYEEDEYLLESTRQAFTFNSEVFSDCIAINQSDNQDFIVYLDQRKEIYARSVGLIYKETTQLQYCTQNDCLGQQVVESGVIYKQTIKSYGVE